MNWGGFAGGFSSGFQNGVAMGKTFKQAQKERQLADIREKGIAEAREMQQKDIDGLVKQVPMDALEIKADAAGKPYPAAEDPLTADQPVQTGAVPSAAQGITARPSEAPAPSMPVTENTNPTDLRLAASGGDKPAVAEPAAAQPVASRAITAPQQPWAVGDKGFATRDEAVQFAKSKANPVSDYFYQTVYPKMVEAHVANGDLDQAEKLQSFIKSQRGERAVAAFGGAMSKMMAGDTAGGAGDFANYAKKFLGINAKFSGQQDDGRLRFVLEEGGKSSDHDFTPAELLRLGMSYDPAKTIDLLSKQVDKQEAAQAEAAKEKRKFANDVALKGIEHGYKQAEKKDDQNFQMEKLATEKQLESANAGAKSKAEAKASMEILRQNGYDETQIRGLLPSILKLGDHKKVTEPTERRAIIVTELSKNPMFVGKSADELNKEADKMMGVIYGATPASPEPASATPASPASGGMTPQAGRGKGVPFFNPATKQIEYR